ncbi:Rv0361 family membrane protein [Nocardia callitridis]|uniref:Uncharacterized protein n=1 Tax=Nocardia callitridis TaxID=648753 RepID=A0ABP9JUL0_9NOCA
MTEQPSTEADDDVITVDQTDARSLVPFIAAGVLAVLVLAGIVIGGLLSPAEKNVTAADKLAAAVRNYVEGVNSAHTLAPSGAVCRDFDAGRSPLAGQDGVEKTVEVTNIDTPEANGEQGKATVTTKVDGKETTAQWRLISSSGKWLVCNQPIPAG